MREVAYRLEKEGRLGASNFFVRSDAGALGSTLSVFPTIAFQLASSQSSLRSHFATAAREFMQSESRSIKEQLETLILRPLSAAQAKVAYPSVEPIVVVLDALDEANGDLVTFLKVLKELVDKQHHFRILITTRPEAPILHALRKADITASVRLFLRTSFQDLRWRDTLLSANPNAVGLLTEKAERLFIYAKTVTRHLDCKTREVSVRRLHAILNDSAGATGISALDELYASVLRNAYDVDALSIADVHVRVTAVLAGLVILQDQVTIDVLAPLMGVSVDDAVRTVEELRSIVTCSGPDLRNDIIRPLHLTLRKFLVDKERCKNHDISSTVNCITAMSLNLVYVS
jgi:hypothetical protein